MGWRGWLGTGREGWVGLDMGFMILGCAALWRGRAACFEDLSLGLRRYGIAKKIKILASLALTGPQRDRC